MANDIILKDYQALLGQISVLESRLNTVISQTSSALSTINTDYDFIETESQGEEYDSFGGFLLNAVTFGISGQVNKHNQINEINEDIEYDIGRCRDSLKNLKKYVETAKGLLATFTGVFDGLYNGDCNTAEDIQELLNSYNLTSNFSAQNASTSLSYIRDNTEKTSFDVKKHDSYGSMSLKQAFMGDFTDDQTMAGAGLGIILQFIPFVDTACDIRDVAADGKNIYEYENSNDKSFGKAAGVYGFSALDVAAFVPFVGIFKYSDEVADGVKAVDKVHDVVKSIDKVKDARKSMTKIDDIADAAKSTSKGADAGKTAKQGAEVGNNIGDTAKGTERASDAGKTTKNTGEALSDAGKVTKENSELARASEVANNYKLTDEQFNDHILKRHGPNSNYNNRDHFNDGFDIKKGIDDTLHEDSTIISANPPTTDKAGNIIERSGYNFEKTYDTPIGTSPDGKPLYTLKVVIDENGNVITAFPKKKTTYPRPNMGR